MKSFTSFLALSALASAGCGGPYGGGMPTDPAGRDHPRPTAARDRAGFGFNGTASGFPTGVVFLTGGGSFAPATATDVVPAETDGSASGGFRCVETVAQGPLAGCASGEGVRWDTSQLLARTTFKCTGADALKTAVTGPATAVLLADFYRAGDGNHESFTARIIVSDTDLAADVPGDQTLWIQGVGCGDAKVGFDR